MYDRAILHEQDIVKRLTGADETRISFNDRGFMSRTYLVDDGRIVFKFPRSSASQEEYAREVPVLIQLLKSDFGVHVPLIRWYTPDHDYIGYYGIPGGSLLQDIVHKLGAGDKSKIGAAIGLFLQRLHSLELTHKPLLIGVEAEFAKYQARYQMVLPTLKAFFSAKELLAVDDFFMNKMPEIMTSLGETLAFCHGDLGLYNILLLENSEVGVIDFGDAGMYDHSKDFIALEDQTILESAIHAYGGDERLRDKIAVRRKAYAVLELHYYIQIGDAVGIRKWLEFLRDTK